MGAEQGEIIWLSSPSGHGSVNYTMNKGILFPGDPLAFLSGHCHSASAHHAAAGWLLVGCLHGDINCQVKSILLARYSEVDMSFLTTSFYFLISLLSWQPELQPGLSPVPVGLWLRTCTCALRAVFSQPPSKSYHH